MNWNRPSGHALGSLPPIAFAGAKAKWKNFIFYRGVGHFPLPLQVTSASDGTVTVHNGSGQRMRFVWVYRMGEDHTLAESWTAALAPGESRVARDLRRQDVPFAQALVAAGLTAAEASALRET